MISNAEARAVINDLFEEEALIIGGLVVLHSIEDEAIWRLIRSLDAIRRKALRRLAEEDPTEDDTTEPNEVAKGPHPAIQEFLLKLHRD
tara:strand:+ start:1015 stop:1281 length:267 start_codon:yes stop_codon:yes gene_type:complete